MKSSKLYSVLKIIAQAAVIYLFLRYLPNINMNQTDCLIVTSIIVLSYTLFDQLCIQYSSSDDNVDCSKCIAPHENFSETSKPTATKVTPKTKSSKTSKSETSKSETSKTKSSNSKSSDTKSTISVKSSKTTTTNTSNNSDDDSSNTSNNVPISDKCYHQLEDCENRDGVCVISSDCHTELQANGLLNKPVEKKFPSTSEKERQKKDISQNSVDNTVIGIPPTVKYGNSIYYDDSVLPMTKKASGFEDGYSFLPPQQWYPQPLRPPVCVSENKACVQPLMSGVTDWAQVKYWNESNKVTPQYELNMAKAKKVLKSKSNKN